MRQGIKPISLCVSISGTASKDHPTKDGTIKGTAPMFSKYQKSIFAFVAGEPRYCEPMDMDAPLGSTGYRIDFNGKQNAVVEAVAGSGKTTTIVEALKHLPKVGKLVTRRDVFGEDMPEPVHTYSDPNVLFVAFNKHIAEELQRRVPRYVKAATLNSVGWGICRENSPRVTLDIRKDENILRTQFSTDFEDQRKMFYKLKNAVCKMIGLLKALNITSDVIAQSQFYDIADKYDVTIPENLEGVDFKEVVIHSWLTSIHESKFMNFDDQIFMPVYNNWNMKKYDWVFGDEVQDWSPIQTELVRRLASRLVAVGDRHQSIYGFRGADPDAIPNIITTFDAVVLPLSICYRCPDSVIAKAREIVPHIENPSDNPKGDGVVAAISTSDFIRDVRDGDYVLCRTTAPLVKRCLELIRGQRKAVVKGRDIGQGLLGLLEKLAPSPSTPVSRFLESLGQHRAEQVERLNKAGREVEALAMEDRCDTLEALALGCNTTMDIKRRVDEIFSDEEIGGVTFCTIHRSKGLEADRIYILRPDLCPHPKSKKAWQKIQEDNLLYVAITRAMAELYFVTKEKDEK